jgi:hypothetical protein
MVTRASFYGTAGPDYRHELWEQLNTCSCLNLKRRKRTGNFDNLSILINLRSKE